MKQVWTLIAPHLDEKQNDVVLTDEEHHYAAHVLRLTTGDAVEIVNGQGLKASGHLSSINKKELVIAVDTFSEQKKSLPRVHLWLAAPKPSTLEEVVAASSELGAECIHIFKSEKSASKAPLKKDKLQKMSSEAMRISKSPFAAAIHCHESLEVFYNEYRLESQTKGLILFCDESSVYTGEKLNSIATAILQHREKDTEKICILIGPEASFTASEHAFIMQKFKPTPVSLGNNILRVPNAVISALGICLTLCS